jgi:hypothetical protein
MDLYSWFQSHATIIGMTAAVFGSGLRFKWLCEKLADLLAWMATTQGQAAVKDLDAALDVIFQSLKDAGHAAPQNVVDGIIKTIASAQADALKRATQAAPQAPVPAAAPSLPPASPTPAAAPKMTPSGRIVGMLVVGLLLGLGAGSLAAANAYDLSVGAPTGSSVWRFTDGGKLVSDGSAVAGMGLVLSEGASDTTGAYTPHIALIAGVGGETVGGANYADGFLGLGPIIPGINIPVLAAANWRVGTGQQPAIMLATSVNCNLTLWHKVR